MKSLALCKMFVLILSIVICAGTAIGGTVAWFTDEVSTTNSVIKNGSLDVEMDYSEELAGPYMDVESTSGSIFN